MERRADGTEGNGKMPSSFPDRLIILGILTSE